MLYVKRDKIDKLWPLMAAEAKQASDIRKFEEIGTHSAAPKLAIGEALLFYNGIGGKRKEARLRYLSRYWMKPPQRCAQDPVQHFVRFPTNRAQ